MFHEYNTVVRSDTVPAGISMVILLVYSCD